MLSSLMAAVIISATVTLDWQQVPGQTGLTTCIYQWAMGDTAPPSSAAPSKVTSATSVSMDLRPGNWSIAARNYIMGGSPSVRIYSGMSNIISIVIPPNPPPAPVLLRISFDVSTPK